MIVLQGERVPSVRGAPRKEVGDVRAIVTGFEPFGGMESNPTARAARELDGIVTDGVRIEGRLLPVSIEAIAPAAIALANELKDEHAVVVATGLAAGRSGLAVERVAINCADFATPDNEGQTRSGEQLEEGGIAAYFTTLPMQHIVTAWRDAGLSGYVSNSAGTYICNAWFYLLRAHLQDTQLSGFIHVPCTPDMVRQSQKPSMSYNDIRLGIELAVRTSLLALRERMAQPLL